MKEERQELLDKKTPSTKKSDDQEMKQKTGYGMSCSFLDNCLVWKGWWNVRTVQSNNPFIENRIAKWL